MNCGLRIAGCWAGVLLATPAFALNLLQGGLDAALGGVALNFEPRAAVRMMYDDNILLSVDEQNDALGVTANMSALVSVAYETTFLEVTPRGTINRYDSEEDLDSQDVYVDFVGGHVLESDRFDITGGYYDDTTRASELTDTGLVRDLTDRNTLTLSPGWTRFWGPRTTSTFSFGYTDVEFPDAQPNAGLIDYSYLQGNAGGSYALTERLRANASTFWTQFKVTGTPDRTRTLGAQIGAEYDLSESLTIGGLAGYQHSRSRSVIQVPVLVIDPVPRIVVQDQTQRQSDQGIIWTTNIDYRRERTLAEASYSKAIQPSSRGAQTENETIFGQVLHKLRYNLFAIANVDYEQRTTQQGQRRTGLDRDRILVRGGFRWRVQPHWVLQGTYRFRWRTTDSPNSTATSHGVLLTVSYQGESFDLANNWLNYEYAE